MTKEEVIAAIERYEQGKCTDAERGLLESWYNQCADQQAAAEFPDDLWTRKENSLKIILRQAIPYTGKPARVYRLGTIGIAAAVVLVFLGLIFWFYKYNPHPVAKNSTVLVSGVKDSVQVRKGVTLTFSNGKVLQLNAAKSGIVIRGNKLSYNDGSFVRGTEARLRESEDLGIQSDELIISVPPAMQYHVQLADGSKIWLNADSRLKIAGSFNDNFARTVGLVGEAYFEVAKSERQWRGKKRKRPFYVLGKRHSIAVLGTCFNVSSYPAEPAQISLLEGSVEVNSQVLRPGEQATISRRGGVAVKTVDMEGVLSWRSGYFRFEDEEMENVMSKISRWYDVDVQYEEEGLKHERLSGIVIRYNRITDILGTLQKDAAFRFELKGRTLLVRKLK
ncbi:transmembrane sensor [Pedobacter africanus]|uniref:Ferric-dicitrate binding protein FerR (Iron transport regulator) n=1 Tax=Pedobacter africanus TaxID=151894 RepID=A0ACC6KQ02_9SPHI|nr:FecR domain-containing protein [Pedobacter africanus]MDR6781453.1 ferric-dicitrate binding protein FerR (iron transport regulator) [Pedobacter africanus]